MTEMHIRFGDLPQDGRSWNHEADDYEPGVSVYRATWDNADRDSITIEISSDAEYAGGMATGLFERPVYVVTGTLLDERGGDGELLMAPGCKAELIGSVEVVNYVVEENA